MIREQASAASTEGGEAVLRFTVAQLLLVELAAACAAGGLALGGGYRYAGIAAAVVVAVLAVGRRRGRWFYQVLLSALGFLRRRQGARPPGLAGVLGDYQVESVPGGANAATIGAVRCDGTWCVPLLLGLEDVLDEDAGVPVRALTALLQVEDIALASVRLLTVVTPAPAVSADAGLATLGPLASRYVLLSLDGGEAVEAVAARGATRAAVHQMLRRCVVHAEDVLGAAGVGVHRLDEVAVASLFATWLGPAAPTNGRRARQAVEGWCDVRLAGTRSTVVAVTGAAPGVTERAQQLAATAPTPLAATCLAVLPGRRAGEAAATLLLRVSAPDTEAAADVSSVLAALAESARGLDLVLQPVGGEQVPLLRATLPVGLARPPGVRSRAPVSTHAYGTVPATAEAAL